MFLTHFIDGDASEKQSFRRYSNILTKIKALSKKHHFHSEPVKSKQNVRKTWEITRSVLPSKSNREPPSSLIVNGINSDDPVSISNEINIFFCSIGSKLAEN